MNDNNLSLLALNKTPKYECNLCDFKCSKNCDYQRHIATLKHVHRVNDNDGAFFNAKHICLVCNTHYNHASGLSRHKKYVNIPNLFNQPPYQLSTTCK